MASEGNDPGVARTPSYRSDPQRQAAALRSPVLTDAEDKEIRRGLASGLRGPVIIKSCEQLLADRDERRAQELPNAGPGKPR